MHILQIYSASQFGVACFELDFTTFHSSFESTFRAQVATIRKIKSGFKSKHKQKRFGEEESFFFPACVRNCRHFVGHAHGAIRNLLWASIKSLNASNNNRDSKHDVLLMPIWNALLSII